MKDTYYFSHDYNSRSDNKIKKLIREFGYLGYGLFWAIIEDLYQNANALQTDYEGIAFDLRVEKNIIKSIINDFDLFIVKDDTFGSESVERRLNERLLKSKKAKDSANKRWEKHRNDANALQTDSDSNAIKEKKGKESKGKESKGNEKKENKKTILNNFSKVCKEDQIWLESVAMKTGKMITFIIEKLDEFNNHVISQDQTKNNLTDYKSHFANWFTKKYPRINRKKSPLSL